MQLQENSCLTFGSQVVIRGHSLRLLGVGPAAKRAEETPTKGIWTRARINALGMFAHASRREPRPYTVSYISAALMRQFVVRGRPRGRDRSSRGHMRHFRHGREARPAAGRRASVRRDIKLAVTDGWQNRRVSSTKVAPALMGDLTES